MVPIDSIRAKAYIAGAARNCSVRVRPRVERGLHVRDGIVTQVPAKTAYVTTGKPRKVKVWNVNVDLYKTTLPKTLTRPLAYMALQALDNMGPDYVDQKMIDKTAKHLKPADKKDIHDNLRYIRNPWLVDIARQISV